MKNLGSWVGLASVSQKLGGAQRRPRRSRIGGGLVGLSEEIVKRDKGRGSGSLIRSKPDFGKVGAARKRQAQRGAGENGPGNAGCCESGRRDQAGQTQPGTALSRHTRTQLRGRVTTNWPKVIA
jgi:hypothetical protein